MCKAWRYLLSRSFLQLRACILNCKQVVLGTVYYNTHMHTYSKSSCTYFMLGPGHVWVPQELARMRSYRYFLKSGAAPEKTGNAVK